MSKAGSLCKELRFNKLLFSDTNNSFAEKLSSFHGKQPPPYGEAVPAPPPVPLLGVWVQRGVCWAASFSSIKKKLCHPLQFLHSVTASPSNNSRNLLVVLLMGKVSPDQQNKEKKKVISGRIQIIKCNITRRLALSRHAAGP